MKKQDRQLILDKYSGKCAYCGEELQKGWHVDHIEPMVSNMDGTNKYPERDVIENYNPSCASCNIQKNSFTIEQFRENIKRFIPSLNQYSTQYKFAKKYGLVSENEVEVKFYFEQYSARIISA